MLTWELTPALSAVAGALLGSTVTLLWTLRSLSTKRQDNQRLSAQLDSLSVQAQEQHASLLTLTKEAGMASELRHQRDSLQNQLAELQHNHAKLFANNKSLQSSFAQREQALQDKVELLTQTEQRLMSQFETLALKTLDKQSDTFAKQSSKGIDAVITPLKEQLETFKRQIADQHLREGQERASLKTEILSLQALNKRITEEAAALTNALKGDNKQQGNWGEVVLERILQESGLREGHEFDTQVSMRSDSGQLQQPDVVVHLPNDKDVVIDSKVTLAAYERYFNSENEEERKQALKEHLASVRGHIKGLGKKDYQALAGIKTLDYVLMFIPIETAFLLAIDEQPDLVTYALSNNIMLVSPTNLLVALRTINNIWQYEYQNQNAQKIADHGAKLYDKFSNFINDMEKIGKAIDGAQKHYDSAFSKLSHGRHNLIRQIEQFRELGVQPNKSLPSVDGDE